MTRPRDALELDSKLGPVGFDALSRALFDAIPRKELVLERVVGQFPRQGPTQPNCCCALEIILHRTAGYSQHDGDLEGAGPASCKPKHLYQLSHGQPSLCRHQNVLVHREVIDAKVADPGGIFTAENWPDFDRNGGRFQIGRIAGRWSD